MDFSQLPLEGFANKDKSIINANPGKSIYELTQAGLSAKAAEKLAALQEETAKNSMERKQEQATPAVTPDSVLEAAAPAQQPSAAVPASVEKVPVNKPILGHAAIVNTTAPAHQTAIVFNKSTGRRVPMAKIAADKLVSREPDKYRIL